MRKILPFIVGVTVFGIAGFYMLADNEEPLLVKRVITSEKHRPSQQYEVKIKSSHANTVENLHHKANKPVRNIKKEMEKKENTSQEGKDGNTVVTESPRNSKLARHAMQYLFEIIDAESAGVNPTNPEYSEFGEAVRLDTEQLKRLNIGHSMSLPTRDDTTLLVEDKEIRNNGSVRIRMSMQGLPPMYRATFTIGKVVTYGRIITPEGGYELEIVNGQGWIVDTRKLDKKIPDDGIDYVVPDN